MLLNAYADALSYLNKGVLLDILVVYIIFVSVNSSNVNFFSPLVNFTTFIKIPLLNVRKISIWKPYFKKDGYMGYLVDLIIWK